jgi:CubicO group peptidase (beta-lactamase class C family)
MKERTARELTARVLLCGAGLLSVLVWGCALPGPRTPLPEGADTFDATIDLISLHYDHAPDRDDGHSAAADRSLLEVLYGACWLERHVVAVSGAHGWLGFTFKTDSDAVMEAAWGDRGGWLDAHRDRERATADLAARWKRALEVGGDVWVKEGGSSDLTADVVRQIRAELPGVDTKRRIHVVQHGNFNEWLTWLRAMRFTRKETDYRRIRNANAYLNVAGGNDAFESAARSHEIFGPAWDAAFEYYDPRRRLDFSDTGELLSILGLGEVGIDEFGERFLRSGVEEQASCDRSSTDGDLEREIEKALDPPPWSEDITSQMGRAAERAGSSALVVIHRGNVVLEWGAISRRFNGHSVRKSLLSALMGVAVERGLLDVGSPVGSFDLPEGEKLNDVERSATVRELMMSRSGIYLRAANDTPAMMLERPRRNAHAPGDHWYYNNWGFNALGVIFEKSSGLAIGVAFHRWIAVPIGMKDFQPEDVGYESWLGSRHPAYPFWITARDLAAFGLLLAREGRWGDRQVIAREWVQASTHSYSDTGVSGYGFMWWVESGGRLYGPGMKFPSGSFMAVGLGGQYLVIVPACQLVVVNLVDTGRSKLERLRWVVLGDPVESDELESILHPIFLQAGCCATSTEPWGR